MPHIDITMKPGRNDEIKKTLAFKVQDLVATELKVDKSVVTVSIEDISEDWAKHLQNYDGNRFI